LHVAADSGKNVFLTWEQGSVIQVGVRPPGGSFGTSSLYGCPTNPPTFCTSAHSADLAIDPAGNAIVVFLLDGVLKAFARPAGGSFMQLDDITSGLPPTSIPHVALTADGTAVAVWQLPGGLQAAERPPGGSFGAPTPIFTESGGEDVVTGAFDLATGGAGNAMVAFVTHQSSASSQTASARSVARTPAGWLAPTEVVHESVGSDMDCTRAIHYGVPDLTMDSDGDAAVALEAQFTSTAGSGLCADPVARYKIVTARRVAPFAGWSEPDAFDDAPAGGVGDPVATFSSQGAPLVTWIKHDSGGVGWVRYAVGSAGGFGFGSAADVPGSETPLATDGLSQVKLVPLSDGAALVGFVRATPTGWTLDYATRPAGGAFGQASQVTAISTQPIGPTLGATPAGDVVAAWLEDDPSDTRRVQSVIYDASPPVMGDVQVPGSGRVGQALAMSATATDAFSPVSFGWAFGDGTTSTGAQVSHAFGSARRFGVSVTATDAAGNASSAGRTVSVNDPRPRFIGRIRLAHARFRAARRGHSAGTARRRRAPVGSRVSFRLSEAAKVRFTVERARSGRRRYVKQRGGFTIRAAAGRTRFRFTGRLRQRKLRPARYRLVGVATDASGQRSAPKRVRFRIVR